MGKAILIKGATAITMDRQNRILEADVLIEDQLISKVDASIRSSDAEVIDARGLILLPGFVQSHVHLCQTLFRGVADDLALIDWLKLRIWPLEAAHTPESLYASARLGIAELIRGGTTCALTMETVHHTEAVFNAVEESGFRATVGKCMMDKGEGVPEPLCEKASESIEESLRLLDEWDGRGDGRIRCCFAPRFAVSCTRELLESVAEMASSRGVLVHTHASENRDEIAVVELETGLRNIEYLSAVGLTASNVVLAHCVHLNDREIEILNRTGTHVAHCPSSNLKLGSGIARIPEMVRRGVSVSLGADGAPCNNRLDMFTEMRTSALIQKAIHGAQIMPAASVLRMATINGANALGLGERIGSIEPGKQADLILVNLNHLHATPHPDPVSAIVYSAEAADVETVIIAGKVVMRGRELTTLDEKKILESARSEASSLAQTLTSQ
jgi:5-methylthioadenosine/S-adenosylhomocysteine deaminase